MERKKEYNVLALGAPVVDYLVHVAEDYLKEIPGEKGGQVPVDYDLFKKIVDGTGKEPQIVPGGSATNVIKGLARLGQKCALIGKGGGDDHSDFFIYSLKEMGIHPLLTHSETPTARVVSLVTPDGERTMRTYLGACLDISSEDLKAEDFEGIELFHVEGYALFNSLELPKRGMQLAKEAGAKVSLDLSSFELVQLFGKEIHELLENYVDIVFCNEEEAKVLTGTDPEETSHYLKKYVEVAVVSCNVKGCWVATDEGSDHCEAYPVKAIDSTGAGDLFASGFLHGYLQGKPKQKCAHIGALLGRAVVQNLGAEIAHELWQEIEEKL